MFVVSEVESRLCSDYKSVDSCIREFTLKFSTILLKCRTKGLKKKLDKKLRNKAIKKRKASHHVP